MLFGSQPLLFGQRALLVEAGRGGERRVGRPRDGNVRVPGRREDLLLGEDPLVGVRVVHVEAHAERGVELRALHVGTRIGGPRGSERALNAWGVARVATQRLGVRDLWRGQRFEIRREIQRLTRLHLQ